MWDLNVQNCCHEGTCPAEWRFYLPSRSEIRTELKLGFTHGCPRRLRPGFLSCGIPEGQPTDSSLNTHCQNWGSLL